MVGQIGQSSLRFGTLMKALPNNADGFEFTRSSQGIVQSIDGQNWLLLMQFEADDRLGNDEKQNGAYMVDRNFQQDGGEARERVTFDSIINSLPVDFYMYVAGLSDVAFVARLKAPEWHLQVFSRVGRQMPNLVAEVRGTGAGEITLPFDMQKDKGQRISVTITYRGTLESNLLGFATPAPAKMQPLGLSITTYNKPQYLLHNLNVIQSSNAYKDGLIDLLVVNNGDPVEGLPEDITEIKPGNVGGTGGFQVAAEHFKEKSRRHFIIMDDDIVLPDDTVDRFFALSCFVKGHHIGSLAEIENTPERIVKEQGANVLHRHLFGLEMINQMLNIHDRDRTDLYSYQLCDYSGWWALMVDLEAAAQVNVPSYYFIKRDDITFGFESRRNDTPTVVFPNLLIAHSEEGSTSYLYYDIRNDLIMRARNNDVLGISLKGLARVMVTSLLTYRLEDQRMFNQALADFIKGPKFLASRSLGDTLRKVRGLAGKRIPLPEGNPSIFSEHSVPTWRLVTAWLRPSAWRSADPLPLVPFDHHACVTEIGGYIARLPFSKTGIVYRRRFANIGAFAKGAVLLTRFSLGRKKIISRYQEAK